MRYACLNARWTFVVGHGSAGYHFGKEIYCFRHHFGGRLRTHLSTKELVRIASQRPVKHLRLHCIEGCQIASFIQCGRVVAGMVIEIPSKSNGDIRLRNCLGGEIVACAADGILWKRDSFFGEHSLSDWIAAPVCKEASKVHM